MTIPNPSVLPVRSTANLLALIPYLIGYTPADSLVSVALDQSQVVFAGRIDLPTAPPGENTTTDQHGDVSYESDADEIAATLATFTLRQHPTSVVLVGYGPATRVNPSTGTSTVLDTGTPRPTRPGRPRPRGLVLPLLTPPAAARRLGRHRPADSRR